VFLDNSRYFGIKTVQAKTESGREVTAVALRRVPYAAGAPTVVKGNDRLDVMAQRLYSDGTKFWHIADANSELQANDLLRQREHDIEARIINVPEK